MDLSKPPKFETNAIRAQLEKSGFKEHSVPLYLTSSFTFDDSEEMRASFSEEIERNIYSRFTNPNNSEFIHKLCLMEGTEAGIATATGMASVFSTMAALCKSGDHIISAQSIFGSTHSLFQKFLPRWNITTSYGDLKDTESWDDLVQPNTKLLYLETPTNPGVDLIDLEWVGAFAKRHGILLVVDNCFATPYLQQPAKYGADLVLHSATKFIDGQGRVLGGAVLGSAELIREIYLFSRNTGPALSPFNAWVLSKSLETLAIRMDRHCQNALQLATYLESHDQVSLVKYPFLKSHPQYELAIKQMKAGGGVVTFEHKRGLEGGKSLIDNVQMISRSANLGDSRSIITHPASTTHSKLSKEERLAVGITDGMVRVSVGLENIDDIIADFAQAL